jgi:putative CocE/NonD family hydrolase
MALSVSPHDLAEAGFGHGTFELFNLLTWADVMANQENFGALRLTWRTITADGRLQDGMNRLPLAATGDAIDGAGPPTWYADWMKHTDPADGFWDGYRAGAALDRVTVPTLLVSGFHDFFAEQTMQQYHALRSRGVPVGLTVGPWAHLSLDMGVALRETLAWLDTFADGDPTRRPPRAQPVRVWTSGIRRWRDLPDWPPAEAEPCGLYLAAGGELSVDEPAVMTEAASTAFRYDPADPTPSVGGRVMSVRHSGSQNNDAIEARADVLTFSSGPLSSAVEVAGAPSVDLYITSDNDCFDIFARLCDVDQRGRSRNLTDQIVRFTPDDVTRGQVHRIKLALTDVSHVFLADHRVRLQVSGGAHPRFARNLGTPEDPETSTAMAPVNHHIQHSQQFPSALVLPVVGAEGLVAALAELTEPGRLDIPEPAAHAGLPVVLPDPDIPR